MISHLARLIALSSAVLFIIGMPHRIAVAAAAGCGTVAPPLPDRCLRTPVTGGRPMLAQAAPQDNELSAEQRARLKAEIARVPTCAGASMCDTVPGNIAGGENRYCSTQERLAAPPNSVRSSHSVRASFLFSSTGWCGGMNTPRCRPMTPCRTSRTCASIHRTIRANSSARWRRRGAGSQGRKPERGGLARCSSERWSIFHSRPYSIATTA